MIDHGSFRDPDSRVFYREGRVLRGLTEDAATTYRDVAASGLMVDLVDRGMVVANHEVDDVATPPGVPSAAVVESARVPLITYPGEWSFSMLRDAALLTLDITLEALDRGFILRDASAYNIAFAGPNPRFIDIGSFERFGDNGVWAAYGQFCDHFLAPLMLEAYIGVPFQPRLSGQVDGLPITELSQLLRGRARWRRGVLSHVRVRAALERRSARMETDARRRVGAAELPVAAVRATVAKMRKLVASLESDVRTTWAQYEAAVPYDEEAFAAKERFVASAAEQATSRANAADFGANAGHFTRILAGVFESVAAIDSDAGAVDALYQMAKRDRLSNVTPIVADVANPQGSFGWRGMERASLADRLTPGFATWLAITHHLCLGAGLPLGSVVEMMLGHSRELVIEFVHADDAMARHVVASRPSQVMPYSRELFEAAISGRATIVATEAISPTRTMYHLRQ